MIHSNLRSENQTWEFRHPQFRKGAIEDLQKIKRKSVKGSNRPSIQTGPITPNVPSDADEKAVETLPKEYTVLEERLVDMSRAFNSLYDEMSFLRTTLMRQQDLMEDIVTFMTTLQDDLESKWAKTDWQTKDFAPVLIFGCAAKGQAGTINLLGPTNMSRFSWKWKLIFSKKGSLNQYSSNFCG